MRVLVELAPGSDVVGTAGTTQRVRHVYSGPLLWGFCADVDADHLEWLRVHPAVLRIETDAALLAYSSALAQTRVVARTPGFRLPDPDPGTPSPHLFLLDSGVARNHPDLHIVEARSFVPDDASADDALGHGTRLAGLAAARDNATHVVGVAPGAPIHSFKVLDGRGRGWTSDLLAALQALARWRQFYPAVGATACLGLGATDNVATLEGALARLVIDHGILVVAAAGNERLPAAQVSPARAPEVLTVGAYDLASDRPAPFSNGGAAVDIWAPGTGLPVLAPQVYGTVLWEGAGTSLSAALVAGACLRIQAAAVAGSGATPAEVRARLLALARPGAEGTPVLRPEITA